MNATLNKNTDRVTFVKGLQILWIRENLCGSCFWNVSCTGPFDKDGIHADLKPPKGVSSVEMSKSANCLKESEPIV